jgi:predicted phosphodiesterase
MKRFSTFSLYLIILVAFQACDLIEYHPYDSHVKGATHLTYQMIQRIQDACAEKDTIRFAQISDTQRWYDETQDLVNAINAHGNIDFVIHTGDQTDFGLTKEFIWQRNIMAGFKMPFVCIIGNHDCLGLGEETYHKIYGNDNFSFNAGFLHVVCLNTNAFEYDYSSNIPDFQYIKQDIDSVPPGISRTIVAMHAIPYSEQFNNNIAEYFNLTLQKYPGLTCCLCGHDHHNDVIYPFKNGVPYYECAAAREKTYLLFTITKNSYTYEIVKI